MNECLTVKNISKTYPGFELKDVSFSLPKGYIMGLVGPNGAGKTTTIKLILDMIDLESGKILIFGKDSKEDLSEIKKDIGVVFDSIFYVSDWTAKETEKANELFYENWDSQVFRNMLERFQLPQDKKVKDLSRGMQVKFMLACAFSHDAKLLILDEPTSGLDPVFRDEFLSLLQEYIEDGERSVLFSTHITTDLEQVADYITYLDKGSLIYTGSLDELLEKYRLAKGKISDLTPELEGMMRGFRKTSVGFEGLIDIQDSRAFDGCVLDTVTVNDIVVSISKEN